jgi:hypothetical protein
MPAASEGQRVCPLCKLISPATADQCDCGYDFGIGKLPDGIDPPRTPRSRAAGALFICVGVLGAVVFLLQGVPNFLHESGWLAGLGSFMIGWAAVVVFLATGLVLLVISYATKRAR